MISQNADGSLIAAVIARFGIGAIRGSSRDPVKRRDKGGVQALRAGLDALDRRRAVLVLTPDGPRGPAMVAAPGVAELAIRAQVPVLPMAFAARPAIRLGSWDRFLVPLPFGRGAQVFGAPLAPPAPGDRAATERFRAAIEDALCTVTARADALTRAPAAPSGGSPR